MARDYTKYSLNGTGKYSKSKLALAIVEKFMEDSFEVTIEDIRESFPLPSKSKGFISPMDEIEDAKRFNDKILTDFNGIRFKVSNQWSLRSINDLIKSASDVYQIVPVEEESSESEVKEQEQSTSGKTVNVRFIIRNSEDAEDIDDCPYLDILVSNDLIALNPPFSIAKLEGVKSKLLSSADIIKSLQNELNKYPLIFSRNPQLWIGSIDDLDLTCALKLFFEDDETQDVQVKEVLKLEEYDLEEYYESDGVYSVEHLLNQ